MAAVYLHNALYANQPPDHGHLFPHVRATSTNSDTTVFTSTDQSHPSQPLLHPSTSEPAMLADSAAPSQPHYTRARDSHFLNKPVIPQQSSRFRRHRDENRLHRLKVIHRLLEIVPPAWAIYNCIRYFLAFALYESSEGRNVSLALGILTGVSFALYACAFVISIFRPHLIRYHIPPRQLLFAEVGLKGLASAALFVPSVVSLVLLKSWKFFASSELDIESRCHVDIDTVWSFTKKSCPYSPWGVWLALSLLRLVVTLLFIMAYHAVFFAYHRHLRRLRPFGLHRRSRNLSESSQSSLPPVIPGPLLLGMNRHHLQAFHNTSDSTLRSQPNSKNSLNYPTPSNARSYTDDGPSGYSEQELKDLFFPHDDSSITLQPPENNGIDHENYHSLVSQVIRETEATMETARSETTSETDSGYSDHLDRPMYPANIGYDEFGRPYPPEFDVPVLNGLVRRLPTIESAGSREAPSMLSSSPYSSDRETLTTRNSLSSQSPTRTNTLAFSEYSLGNYPASRQNSAAAMANELGEIIATPANSARPLTPGQSGTGFSYPSTGSYYTATSHRTAVTTPLSLTSEPEELEHTPNPPGLDVDELGRHIKR